MRPAKHSSHWSWHLLWGVALGVLVVSGCGDDSTATTLIVITTGETTQTTPTTQEPTATVVPTTTTVPSEPDAPNNAPISDESPIVEQCGKSRQSDWLCVITAPAFTAAPNQTDYQEITDADAGALESLTWVFTPELSLVRASFRDESDCYFGLAPDIPTEILSRSQGGLFLIRLGNAYCEVVESGWVYVYECNADPCPLSVRFDMASGKLTVRETQTRIENLQWSSGVLEIFLEGQQVPELVLFPGDAATYLVEERTVVPGQ